MPLVVLFFAAVRAAALPEPTARATSARIVVATTDGRGRERTARRSLPSGWTSLMRRGSWESESDARKTRARGSSLDARDEARQDQDFRSAYRARRTTSATARPTDRSSRGGRTACVHRTQLILTCQVRFIDKGAGNTSRAEASRMC